MKSHSDIGAFLRDARELKGWSRSRLASICARRGRPVHINTIYRLESGKRQAPNARTIHALCDALGFKLEPVKGGGRS